MNTNLEEHSVDRGLVEDPDPILDIIDYLIRCANISFKNAHIEEREIRTSEKVRIAHDLFLRSPTVFLMRYGKYLTLNHLKYFDTINISDNEGNISFQECLENLKEYHSPESSRKRIRNRRYKALQKMQQETTYFSEKEMMYRNPLLYEQLIGQFLDDDEIRQRDDVDNENLTFLNMILETVDRNAMRQTKNEQILEESNESNLPQEVKSPELIKEFDPFSGKRWGDFEKVDIHPSYIPETRKQAIISAPERKLLRQEFVDEMFTSFLEGRDPDIDYKAIDENEQYDDLQQVTRDAEDKYFDSESNDVDNLECHMNLVNEYKASETKSTEDEDPFEEFMTHIHKKLQKKS